MACMCPNDDTHGATDGLLDLDRDIYLTDEPEAGEEANRSGEEEEGDTDNQHVPEVQQAAR